MKLCPRCGESDLSQFGKNKSKRDGLQTHCKVCRKEVNAAYYQATKHDNTARAAWRTKNVEQNRRFILDYLSERECSDCQNSDVRVLEFDHVRGVKVDNVARMVYDCSISKLQEEVEKCDVVCANCHRIRTVTRGGHYKASMAP